MTHCSGASGSGAAWMAGAAFSAGAAGFSATGFSAVFGCVFWPAAGGFGFSARLDPGGCACAGRRRMQPLHQPGITEQNGEGQDQKQTKRRSMRRITRYSAYKAATGGRGTGRVPPVAALFPTLVNARREAGRRENCPAPEPRRSWRSSDPTDTRRGETAPGRLPARRSRRGGLRRGAGRPSRR